MFFQVISNISRCLNFPLVFLPCKIFKVPKMTKIDKTTKCPTNNADYEWSVKKYM